MASIREKRTPDDSTRFEVRWRDRNGFRSQTEYTEAAAKRLLAEVQRLEDDEKREARELGVSREDLARRQATFKEVGDSWLTSLTRTNTRTANEVRLRVHMYPLIGDRPIRDLVPSEIIRVIGSWVSLAPSTRLGNFNALATVFSWAVSDRLLDSDENPMNTRTVKSRKPRLPRGQGLDAWPEEWVAAVCESIRRDAAIFPVLAAFCGLRQGEVFGLSPEDIGFDEHGQRVIRVHRQVLLASARQFYAPPKHRDSHDKPREVRLPDEAWDALQRFADDHGTRKVTLPYDAGDGSAGHSETVELFMCTREAGAWNRNYFNTRVWKPALLECAIPPTRENGTHALRHWFAYQFLQNGGSIPQLAAALGHHEVGFTLRAYGRFDPRGTEGVTDRMNLLAGRFLNASGRGDGR